MNTEILKTFGDETTFFIWLKAESEKFWKNAEIDERIYGFQIQQGTKWIGGLNEPQIADFEKELGFAFPEVYKKYLRNLNGTDKQAVNVYGSSGHSFAYASAFYSYPRDLEIIRSNIHWIYNEFGIDEEKVRRENIPHIIPIVGHRFLVADNCAANPVLSMMGNDVILYAPTFDSFLAAHIFRGNAFVPSSLNLNVKFWAEDE